MKKRLFLSRLFVLILTLAVLMAGMMLPTLAGDALDPRFATWSYDAATDQVTATFPANHVQDEPCQKIYSQYTGRHAERLYALATTRIFEYENTLRLPTGAEFALFAPNYASESLLLRDEEGYLVMLFTEAGAQKTDAMLSMSEYPSYRIVYTEQNSLKLNTVETQLGRDITALPARLSVRLSAGSPGENMPLSELKYAADYMLVGYADNPHVGAKLGILYDLGDTLGYLDTRSLPRTCFDENGDLDYTSDYEVTLHPLTLRQTEEMWDAIRHATLNSPVHMEESDVTPESPDTIVAFTVMSGILLPIVPVALGITKARSKKTRGTNRWYLLAAMGGVWMLCGVIILISMICILF